MLGKVRIESAETRQIPFSVIGSDLRLFAFVGFQRGIAKVQCLGKGKCCVAVVKSVEVITVLSVMAIEPEVHVGVALSQIVADSAGLCHRCFTVDKVGNGS